MADTGRCEPLVNGNVEAMDDEEKAKIRPADIDADVREMERRKRVEMVMNSRLFREELERIIDTQMKDGNGPSGLLQQLSEMMGVGHGRPMQARSGSCVAPINDIRGVESMGYAKGEKILRCKLAAIFRLMDLYGWTHGIGSQITARLNQEQELFLVNPFGVLFNEVTASSLVKLDMQAAVVEQGTTNFGVNAGAFLVHSALYAARPDVKCVVHVVTPSVLSVSALKAGLLPLCQEAAVLGEASVHHYSGGALGPEGRDKMARDLGPVNKVLLLSNHGALCCGETVEEAFFHVYNLALACDTQMKLLPLGVDNLVLMGDEARKAAFDAARRAPDAATPAADAAPTTPRKEKQWRVGATHFEALMRMLDNAGFRTGYVYRSPLIRAEPPRPRNDIELPPAVASLGYLFDEDDKNGPWRKYVDGRKTHDRTRWLNSPNVYQKVEILETGTPDPRKITKWVESNAEEWVADGSPTHSSTPVKIDSALQFVPKNTHPREFKKLQQQIKDNRRADKITSGPQSHILEGVSWEEAKKLQDAGVTQAGEQVILVGAASKGIIQRGFQHNATVYKTPYAKNPFDAVTDDDLEEYKRSVQRHTKGGESFEEEQSESEALSSSLRRGLASPNTASETEEESRDEPRVLRIETKLVPRASQAEVVLSDAADFPDSGFERSKSLRHSGQAASGGRSAGDFFRSFSLGPAQRKKGVRQECAKRSRAAPPTSRPPLHFHVARLSAAPRVLRTSRLPQTGHGLTLNNPGDRRTKLASGVDAKPSDSCAGLRCKDAVESVIGNGNHPAVPVPLQCDAPTSPDNPFNGLSHLLATVKLVNSQSNPVCEQTTDLIRPVPSPSKELFIPDVIPDTKTNTTNNRKDLTYTKPSPNPKRQPSGLTRSQHLKLLKLRFLELYPPSDKSAKPPPVPPKPSRPVSGESEGYWSTSMTSLASINPLDQSRLNREFDTQIGQLEFSPLVGGDPALPLPWDSARVESCRQRLAEELTQIDDLLEEIGAEGVALRDQLLDLLPGGRDGNGEDEDGEETLCEESANYLDADGSVLRILGLDDTGDDNRVGNCSRKNLCTPEDDDSNACILVDAGNDDLLDKTPAGAIGLLPDDVDENKIGHPIKGDEFVGVGNTPKQSSDLIVLADDCPNGNVNILEINTELGIDVEQHPFDPKVGIFCGMDSTVDFIDASFVNNVLTEDVEINDVVIDHTGTVYENVGNDDHEDNVTNVMQEVMGDFVDAQAASQNNNELEHACKSCTDDALVGSSDNKEFGGVDANHVTSDVSEGKSEGFGYEVITIYNCESVEKDKVGAHEEDIDTNSGFIEQEDDIVVNISTADIDMIVADTVTVGNNSFSGEEGMDTSNDNIKDHFVDDSPTQSDLIANNIVEVNHSFSEEESMNTSSNDIEVKNHLIENKFISTNGIADKVAEASMTDNYLGAPHRPDHINLPHLESMIGMSNHELVNGAPSLDGSMRHWPSLENGMCAFPDSEFDIAECFPEPVRPLQYDDEEYIRKPLRPKRVYHDTEDEEEEVADDEASRVQEEAQVDSAETKESVEGEYLIGPMENGGEDEYFIEGVSFEEFFRCVEEDLAKFFSEEVMLPQYKGDQGQSECNGVGYEGDNEESNAMKPILEPVSDSGDDSIDNVFSFKHELSDCEKASATEFVDNKSNADTEDNLNEDKLHNGKVEGASVPIKTSEDHQPKISIEDLQLTQAINTTREILATDLQFVREELPNQLLNTGGHETDPDIQVVDTVVDSPQNCVKVSNSRYDGEEDSSHGGSKVPTVLEEIMFEGERLFNVDGCKLSDYLHNTDESNPDIEDIDIDSELEYNYDDSPEQNPNPGPAAIADVAAVLAIQRLTAESGGGDASNLFDPLDLEMRRLNGSFIPIAAGSAVDHRRTHLTHSCCLHDVCSSSDTGSTSEGTDFTSPSDAEYEDDMPPVANPQLSRSCRSILESPLHFSFHIRDENNESLELPPSSCAVSERVAFRAETQPPGIVQTLGVAAQDFDILGEAIIASPVAVEEEMGLHGQGETPEDVKPTDVQNNSATRFVEVKKEPETVCLEDTNSEEMTADAHPLAESNGSAGTNGVLASSWYQPGRLWSLISYTEYEPIGNSTTTSQLDVEGIPSMGPEAAAAGSQNETDCGSTVTSPFVSCGSSAQSALSSHFMLSSPESCPDVAESDPHDHPPLSPTY